MTLVVTTTPTITRLNWVLDRRATQDLVCAANSTTIACSNASAISHPPMPRQTIVANSPVTPTAV